jgi:hypothetical protein
MTFEILVPPTRSLAAGLGALAAAAGSIALTTVLVADPGGGPPAVPAILGGSWVLSFLVAARLLLSSRDGLLWDPSGRRVGLILTGPRDVEWIAREDVADVRVQPVEGADEDGGGSDGWRAIIVMQGGCEVVIVESGSRVLAERIVSAMRERLDLVAEGEKREAPWRAWKPGTVSFAVARGAPLQGLVATFGGALTLTGAAAIASAFAGGEPVSGFMLGPVLALAGTALLAVGFVKRFARERLTFDGERWRHAFVLAGRHFGERAVTAARPVWRLRLDGNRGAFLELTGDDGALIVAAGATSRSTDSLATCLTLPERFTPESSS